MLIRFLRDFRSAATNEEFFEAGAEVDLPRGNEVVAEGAAEIVTIDSRRGQAKPSDELPFEVKAPAPKKRGRAA